MKTLLLLLAIAILAKAESVVKPKSIELANNQFAIDLWRKLSADNDAKPEPENLFFSPYSIATALSMVYMGANQNTAEELNSTLRFKSMEIGDKTALAEEIRKSTESMFGQSKNKAYNLSSANALATSDSFQILDYYKKLMIEKFSSEIFSVDFAKDSAGATERINKWIADKTNQKIDKFLSEPMPANTVMALLNAVYFKGSWRTPFNPKDTYKAPFFGLNGKAFQNVSFMSKKAKFNFTSNDDAKLTMVEFPYEGDDVSLLAFLPNSNGTGDFEQMKKQLNASFIEKLVEQKHKSRITVLFPKFSLESKYSLKPTLKSMGVNDLFGDKADFSGLTEQSNIAVSNVRHQARIEVNEEGAEATAVTAIEYVTKVKGPDVVVNFNRPFVFVIRHNVNGQLLFIGEVNRF